LILDFDQVSNTLFSMGDYFAQLYEVSNKFNNSIKIHKEPLLDDVYITLNNMMVEWG